MAQATGYALATQVAWVSAGSVFALQYQYVATISEDENEEFHEFHSMK